MAILENDFLKISSKRQGAELTSILKKANNTEYLWQADPNHWGRHAPVLFPIVGRLKDNQYTYKGQSYTMKQHGLARNMDFKLTKQDAWSVLYELNSNPETLRQYPFPFRLQIQYTLKEKAIIVFYRVINPTTTTMYFSIGGHPAFNCPLDAKSKRSDHQLVFEQKETLSTQRLTDGIRNGIVMPILKSKKELPITDHLFDEDALVFQNLISNQVFLQKGKERYLSFDFSGFPYLGIWSKNQKSPFVCIEPWYGVADHVSHDQDLVKKEGIITLGSKGVFSCYYVIGIY